eukprot:3025583-Pleurochrysis_carterae.AAC.2
MQTAHRRVRRVDASASMQTGSRASKSAMKLHGVAAERGSDRQASKGDSDHGGGSSSNGGDMVAVAE